MIFMSMVMTASVMPLTMFVRGQSPRKFVSYKRRTIQKARPGSELRMVACIHTPRNVSSTISLLEFSNPTKRCPIFVYTVHLVELTERESAILIVHESNRDGSAKSGGSVGGGQGNFNRLKAQSEQINKTFESYEQHVGGVSVHPLTVVSPYSTMHEDVCNLAEDKHAALLILPFHKQHTVDGDMEVMNPGIRVLNQNVLANASCSVGILVDRGFGGIGRIVPTRQASHHIAVLFIGGPDDREALAYTSRMAEHPSISVTLLRFLDTTNHSGDARMINVMTESERECFLDDECVKDFRMKTANDESMVYIEKGVSNGEETMRSIRLLDNKYDLYVVGRGEGRNSALTEGLMDWTESPELGAIGDVLSSSDFTSSVLVIQQYKGSGTVIDVPGSPTTRLGENPINLFLNSANKEKSWGP